MKINRLLEISILLLNRKSVTARELADRFDVSTRTIYRDIDVLSTAGVPVYTNKGKGGGIFLMEDYYIGGTAISDDEYDSLKVALELLQAARYPEVDMVMEKLGSLFKGNDRIASWIDIDITPWGASPMDESKLNMVKSAVLECHVLRFTYYNAYGTMRQREVEPLKLWFKGRGWYLWAYCRDKEGIRLYKISRMKDVLITDEVFQVVHHRDQIVQQYQQTPIEKSMVTVRLRFQPQSLYRMYDDFDVEEIRILDNGCGEVVFTFPEDEWVYGYLLSFGDAAEVMEPQHIRQILRCRAQAIVDLYQS